MIETNNETTGSNPETISPQTHQQAPSRPSWLPEKFKTEADLVRSYGVMERKLAQLTPAPAPAARPQETNTPSRFNSVNIQDSRRASIASGDVIGSAMDRHGTPVSPSDIRAETIVTLTNGFELSVGDAERLGYLRRGQYGYEVHNNEAPPSDPREQQQQQKEKSEKAGLYEAEPMDGPSETQFQGLSEGIPSSLQGQIAREVVSGRISHSTLEAVAATIPGGTMQQAQERIEKAMDLLERQAMASIGKTGANGPQVLEWAEKNAKATLNEAQILHATQRSTQGYQKVVNSYLESLDTIAPDELLTLRVNPGVKIHRSGPNGTGKIVVTDQNGSYAWASAVRHGIVKFKGAR